MRKPLNGTVESSSYRVIEIWIGKHWAANSNRTQMYRLQWSQPRCINLFISFFRFNLIEMQFVLRFLPLFFIPNLSYPNGVHADPCSSLFFRCYLQLIKSKIRCTWITFAGDTMQRVHSMPMYFASEKPGKYKWNERETKIKSNFSLPIPGPNGSYGPRHAILKMEIRFTFMCINDSACTRTWRRSSV